MNLRCLTTLLCGLLAAGCANSKAVQPAPPPDPNAVVPGEFIVEPATLICLGFEWKIAGDENRNASVGVAYRKAGETAWKKALPLLRIGGEHVGLGRDSEYVTEPMFAGSILDLQPDTEYECVLTLSDPDGVAGERMREATVRTRGEPKAFDGGKVLHVYPLGFKGEKLQPAFTGLKPAYAKAEAGDIILVHAGLYKADRLRYGQPAALGLEFYGTYSLTRKGTAGKPIVIRGAGDGEAVFDGDNCHNLFEVMAADYNYFEDLTIRNTEEAFRAGTKRVAGCSGLVVRRCKIEDVGVAVTTTFAGSKDFYIADNTIVGRAEPWLPTDKYSGNRGFSPLKAYHGVMVYGQGHVVCHNYVTRFHDAIDVCTYGPPEEPQDLKPVAIDFYNNDIFAMNDDFFESDGGAHNIRLLRNRCFNSGTCGLSAQPVYGGPAYFIRNVLYHDVRNVVLKFEVRPAGLVVYHNTFVSGWDDTRFCSNVHLRNNLFLGPMRFGFFTRYSTMDYDGFSASQIVFAAPKPGPAMWEDRFDLAKTFKSLSEFFKATGYEQHAVAIGYDIFQKCAKPEDANTLYKVEDVDLTLKPGCAAVDAGCALPNVNDDFTGKAPDLGAYEAGLPAPHYGPRPAK